MGSKPAISPPATSTRKLRRKPSNSTTRHTKPEVAFCHRRSAAHNGGGSTVSDKLEALKSLIPSEQDVEIKPDQLFQETADYIVRLKTQVLVLQKLIEFYGSQPQDDRNAVQ